MLEVLGILCLCVGLTYSLEECSHRCRASYPLHTMDKVSELHACMAGCRLQMISFLSGKIESCDTDCKYAYDDSLEAQTACKVGCESQTNLNKPSVLSDRENEDEVTLHIRLLYPVFSAKEYCFNMLHSAASYVRSSSYVVESSSDSNGHMFMRFEVFSPKISNMKATKEIEDLSENNEEEQYSASGIKHYVHSIHNHASRWLNCVERRAGIPYATLVAILFLSLAMVGWICCTACDDTDEKDSIKRHTFKEGLSIMADTMDKSNGVFTIVNGDAGPLPEKQKLLEA